MTLEVTHEFESQAADGSDSSKVNATRWNANHVLRQETDRILGRVSSGTGATEELTAAQVRTFLGLVIGTNVQAWSTHLDAIAGLAKTDGNIIVGNGTTFVAESGATARTSLGLGANDNVSFISLALGNGSAASPALSFTSDSNTGFYRPAGSTIGIATGGLLSTTIEQGVVKTQDATGTVGTQIAAGASSGSIGTVTNHPLIGITNNAEVFRVSATGRLGWNMTGTPAGLIEVNKSNSVHALVLNHPDATDATYDTTPIAALYIEAPDSATTRNFVSGIWVKTNGNAVDKGRGIAIQNSGASDGLYIQNDGASATGFASLCTATATSATAGVIGVVLGSQIGLVIRQETTIDANADCDTLLQLTANGASAEMMRIGSDKAAIGITGRMAHADAKLFNVLDGSDNVLASLSGAGVLTLPNAGLFVADTGGDHFLGIKPGTDLTANHTLTITTGDADRTLTLNGNATLNDWFDQSVKTTGTPTFAQLTVTTAGGAPTNFQSTQGGTVQFTFKNIPTTGAANDIMDWAFNWKDAAGNEYQGFIVRFNQTVATNGGETTQSDWYTVTGGAAFALQMSIGNGVILGAPTGSFKGAGTLNAVGVYDDNVLLTDYIFDRHFGKEAMYSARVQAANDNFDAAMLDQRNYVAFFSEHHRLWGMPDLNDCIDGIVNDYSLGAMVQKLWVQAELQAIHASVSMHRLDDHEARLSALEDKLAA